MDDRIPSYAILSHRWQDGEVSFQDMQTGKGAKKAGYAKIKGCCSQALKVGLQYVWIDTCCIDKSSSAELSESINSMYRWYGNAAMCYAYLSDVRSTGVSKDFGFAKSVWFLRGWTLQELIAPLNMIFYNSHWDSFGTKASLREEISRITGIDVELIWSAVVPRPTPQQYSIAKRMSWASNRTTTRIEDIAYSLLGIFGVYMPMLYGEGERAFVRLQEEIMKHSDDQSLFVWSSRETCQRGLLAKSPVDFRNCSKIIRSTHKLNRIPYTVTNMGLSLEMCMKPYAMETYLAALDCEYEGRPHSRIGIFLSTLAEGDQFARLFREGSDICIFKEEFEEQSQYKKIYVRQDVWGSSPPNHQMYGFWLRTLPVVRGIRGNEVSVYRVSLWNQWSDSSRILEIPEGNGGTAGITAGVLWYHTWGAYSNIKLGFDHDFTPICQLNGPLWGPSSGSRSLNPSGLEGDLSPAWMYDEMTWLFRGDRGRGLDEKRWNLRVCMTNEYSEQYRRFMWVVDIEFTGGDS